MPTTVTSVTDGGRTTVADLVGAPLAIPARIIEMLQGTSVIPALLRDAGANTNGLVSFEESTPLFLGDDVATVAEFGEIPVAAGQRGLPRISIGLKDALGIRVSLEMRDENKLDQVNTQVRQLVNTMLRAEVRALRATLLNPAIPTVPAAAAWDTPTARIRHDIFAAQEIVASAKPDTGQDDDTFAFEADTVVMHGGLKPALMDNDEFLAIYKDGLAEENPAYTGTLPRTIAGMTGLTSRFWPRDRVLVTEAGTVGFWSDTRPLGVTPLYGEGGGPNGGPTESWRCDATRKRVLGVDQPKAACWITGVRSA
ncbi:hypothetical protein WDZ16_12975 [Pseudokineococcus marinus]|uniref:Phage major capsid protein E n=1 Tax=Pseudokineococcus marinus TaxID=351215 RepID=A0A849BKM8_9ACTN|nr:hypothetical protein [Pseudokineococcus marinus]NNH21647.1 hypothetical protein [Pseudokineococcus marinus]